MVTLYGIPNCDTVKKTRLWLTERGLDYRFHDYRKDGLDLALLKRLESGLGWEAMLNKKGTTWRSLAEAERADVDRDKSIQLMLAHPTLIKRPIVETESKFLIGFDAAQYAAEL